MRTFVQAAALAMLLTVQLAQPAGAAVTASTIDSPASPYYFYDDQSTSVAFHVHGTASGAGNVDVNCYDSTGAPKTLAASVPVIGGAFEADVTHSQAYASIANPCVMRAVPAGDATARPPSATGDPFKGPSMAESYSSEQLFGGRLDNFDYFAYGVGALAEIQSASGGGLYSSQLFAPGTLAPSDTLFSGDGYFNGGSLIKVDGSDAFLPSSASGPVPGWASLQYTKSLEPSTGAVTLASREPAVTCADNLCSSYALTGVELDRTMKTSNDGHVIAMTDSWRSTDGATHALDATYTQGFHTSNAGGAFLFPGTAGFQDYAVNATVAFPHGPGTVVVKEDHTTPDAGDGTHPHGAVSYASTPDSSAVFSQVSLSYSEWDIHYIRTVPATGPLVLRFSYAQQYALADVQALAHTASASFSPSIAISAPADGASTASPNVVVSGTASDGVGVASVKVNGQDATVAGDGSWHAGLVLAPGANHIAAVATNVDGITAERQITVTYRPPVPPSPPLTPHKPVLSLRGTPGAVSNGVSFRVSCTGAACPGSASLTATEIVRRKDGKVIGVAARRRPQTRRKTIGVGQVAFTVQAGRTATVTVRLNATGRRLLARFGRLPVRLSVALVPAPGKPTTIAARAVTIKRKPT